MKEALEKILRQVEELGWEARELVFEEPASQERIAETEERLGISIPEEFRRVLGEVSGHCEVCWFADEEFEMPEEFAEIFCGDFSWNIENLPKMEEKRKRRADTDYGEDGNRIWRDKLAFHAVGNGDMLAIDLSPESYGQVVYLDHEGGDCHGKIMAGSFTELLENMMPIGFPGAECWQWEPFYNENTRSIDGHGENARKWREFTGF